MAHPKGGYRLKSGDKAEGVTTIIGRFKNSGPLLYWAFEQGKAAQRGEIEKLYDRRDAAAQAGTLAHDLFEDWICGGDDISKIVEPYPLAVVEQAQTGFRNAREWFEDTRIEVLDTEMPLVSEIHKFGGCPDAIGKDSRGRMVLLDWKTSSGIYVDYLIQLAAYVQLIRECLDIDIEAVHCVRFSKIEADFEHRKFENIDDAWTQFLLFRTAYEIDKKLKKRVR